MKEFDLYEGWKRNKDGDQPRLVSNVDRKEDRVIPPQIGFTTPNGTDVQMSYQRAVELGLVEKKVVGTERIDVYGQKVVKRWKDGKK